MCIELYGSWNTIFSYQAQTHHLINYSNRGHRNICLLPDKQPYKMSMAFPERPLRGRVELPVQWIVNGDGSVSFHILFLSSIHTYLGFVSASSCTNCFYHYSILRVAPQAPLFSFGLFAIPDMCFHTCFPVAEMRKHRTCIMWDLGIGKRHSHILLPSVGAYCLAILPILSINSQ